MDAGVSCGSGQSQTGKPRPVWQSSAGLWKFAQFPQADANKFMLPVNAINFLISAFQDFALQVINPYKKQRREPKPKNCGGKHAENDCHAHQDLRVLA